MTENAGRELSDLAPYDPESYNQHPDSGGPSPYRPGEYPAGEYPSGEYASGEYPSGEFPSDEYQSGEYQSGEYAGGGFSAGEYASGGYPAADFPTGSPLEFPPFPEQVQEPALPAPAEPAAAQSGIRLSTDAEATARLRIKLPTVKPQPSTTLRPRSSWDRETDEAAAPEGVPRPRAGGEVTAFAQVAASPARPTALPSELAALTTATLVVPLPPDARPTPALLTTTLPPNMAAQANAALLAGAFHDTMEEIFGIDFDAVSRTDIGLADTSADGRAGGWADGRSGRRAGSLADESRPDTSWLLEAFDGEPDPAVDPAFDSLFSPSAPRPGGGRPASSTGSLPALSSTADFGGRYGVPTQPTNFRTAPGPAAQDQARHPLALRYLGGIFHDSTGESAYPDGAADGPPALTAGTGALALFGADAPTEQFARIRPAGDETRVIPRQGGAVRGADASGTKAGTNATGSGGSGAGSTGTGGAGAGSAGAGAAVLTGSAALAPAPGKGRRAGDRSASDKRAGSGHAGAGKSGPGKRGPGKPGAGKRGGGTRRPHDGSRRAADNPASRARGARGSRAVTVLALLVAGFAVLYGIALIVAGGVLGGTVPHGTVVDGIPIGGLSPAAARRALETGLDGTAARPIPLDIGQTTATLDPAASGLSFDAGATVGQADGERTDPFTIIPALFGASHQVAPAISVNSPLLTKTLAARAAAYDIPMIEGEITFTAGKPVVIAPEPGRALTVSGAFAAVTAGYLHSTGPIVLPAQDLRPKATLSALQDALVNIAHPAVAGPLTMTTGAVTTVLTATQIGDAVVIAPNANGDLVPQIDGAMLRADLDPRALAQEQPAVDASFVITNGSPVLVPDHEGIGFSAAALSGALLPALTEPLPRSVSLQAGDLPATFTTADAQALGVTDVLGTSTAQVIPGAGGTVPAASAVLDANTARATKLVAGTVVQPGATFSYLQLIGAPTAADGFTVPAADVKLGVDPSGGIDMVATAVFNAAFTAGMGDTVHHPNASYQYIYPVGLDAAVVYASTDLQWTNTGTHPVYLYATYVGGTLTVAVLGEKSYDQVNIQVSDRTAVVNASTSRGSYPCTAVQAEPGFQVEVTRTLMRSGNQVGSEQFHVTYVPQNGISCGTSAGTSAGPATSPGSGGSAPSSGPGNNNTPPPPAPTPSPTDPGALGGLFH